MVRRGHTHTYAMVSPTLGSRTSPHSWSPPWRDVVDQDADTHAFLLFLFLIRNDIISTKSNVKDADSGLCLERLMIRQSICGAAAACILSLPRARDESHSESLWACAPPHSPSLVYPKSRLTTCLMPGVDLNGCSTKRDNLLSAKLHWKVTYRTFSRVTNRRVSYIVNNLRTQATLVFSFLREHFLNTPFKIQILDRVHKVPIKKFILGNLCERVQLASYQCSHVRAQYSEIGLNGIWMSETFG